MTDTQGGDQPKPAAALGGIDWTSVQLGDLPEIRVALSRPAATEAGTGPEPEEMTASEGLAAPVRLKVIRPEGRGPFPCLYWMHGGGYFSGSAFDDDLRVTRWSGEAGLLVVSVEYRLAPEHPFPAAFEDCLAGLKFVFDKASDLNIDAARIGIGGGSAGGGLAAAVALGARDSGFPPLAFQLLLYPMLDDRKNTSSGRTDVPFWPPAANKVAWDGYLGTDVGGASVSPYAAPARATDLESLPPAYVCVGTRDIFVDESIDYAKRLIDAGVPVDLNVISGAPHGFHLLDPGSEAAQTSIDDIGRFLVRMTQP